MKELVIISLFTGCAPTVAVTEKVEDIPTMEEAIAAENLPSTVPSEEDSEDSSVEPNPQPASEPSIQPASEPSPSSNPCAQPQTITWQAYHPNTLGCNWNQDGNLSSQDLSYRARTEQLEVYTPPSGHKICDIRFDFESNFSQGISRTWGYDDDFILTLNDRVLLASQTQMIQEMPQVSNTYEYNWDAIKGMNLFASPDYFIIGSASRFSAPDPPYVGTSYLYIGSNDLDPYRNKAISDNEIRIMLITLGDNDLADCFQFGFQTNIEIDISQ